MRSLRWQEEGGDVFVLHLAVIFQTSFFLSKALTLLLKWNLSRPHLFHSLSAPGFSKW